MFDYLLLALRDHLERKGFPREILDVRPDGQPPPVCGELFCSLWASSLSPGDVNASMEHGLDETADFVLTVTRRSSFSPQDTHAQDILFTPEVLHGLYSTERRLKQIILSDWPAILCAINERVDRDAPPLEARFLYQAFRWNRTTTPPTPRSSDWFSADPSSTLDCGYSIDIEFTGPRRIQSLYDGLEPYNSP